MLFRGLAALAAVWTACCLAAGWVPGIIIAVPVDWYLASLLNAPTWRCRSCDGHKRHDDVFGSARGERTCWKCGGEGRYPRLGTKLLRPEITAAIKAGKHGRNY